MYGIIDIETGEDIGYYKEYEDAVDEVLVIMRADRDRVLVIMDTEQEVVLAWTN